MNQALADVTGVTFDFLMGYGAAPVTDAPPPVKKISVRKRPGVWANLISLCGSAFSVGFCPSACRSRHRNNWNYYINPAKFREYVGAEAFNTFFGLTA